MERASAWLSRGFEELVYQAAHHPENAEFDVVVVGSGYGGAVAADAFAGGLRPDGSRMRVCVLERGREYLAGMFPGRLADLPGHVRFSTDESSEPRGRREGLFDFRIGADVSALIANGLGGGSLINAGVMEQPPDKSFAGWPERVLPDLKARFFEQARKDLGARNADGSLNTNEGVAKHAALRRLAGGGIRPAPVTIAMEPKTSTGNVPLGACRLCGDCVTGCNREAKDSLDKNLLARAEAAGAEIYAGATVLSLARDEDFGGWKVSVTYTHDKLRRRQRDPIQLRAHRVVLAAGTFGSTEILLRSETEALRFSSRLGSGFSANGDTIAVVYGRKDPVNAVADESLACHERQVGPTITGVIDPGPEGVLIEDLAIPAALRRAFEETVTTSRMLHALSEGDWSDHGVEDPPEDPCAVDARALARTSIVAMMGDDGAAGVLRLVEKATGDGAIRVRWPELRNADIFRRQTTRLRALAKASDPKAKVLPNPLWQLLPENMSFLVDQARGPAFTVHPLGGCPMGKDARDGVVSEFGEVFRGDAEDEVWPGLVVLDGSIVRSALGTNPALTIAALAMRAVDTLRARWGIHAPVAPATVPPREPRPRPVFAPRPERTTPRATRIEIVERMAGEATLEGSDGQPFSAIVELTLPFEPVALAPLVLPQEGRGVPLARRLKVATTAAPGKPCAQLRVFDRQAWMRYRLRQINEQQLEHTGLVWSAGLAGTLKLLHREDSWFGCRLARGLHAYLLNRGLRDTWQWMTAPSTSNARERLRQAWTRITGALKLATRAGEARLLEYDLDIVSPKPGPRADLVSPRLVKGHWQIRGRKRLTYGRRSNPWRQLMEMDLTAFPGLWEGDGAKRTLELDARYLAGLGVPLVRIVDQQDQVAALVDMASFVAYFARMLLNVHVWSFRRPDAHADREVQRLPGVVPGLPDPEVHEISVDRLGDGTPVSVRLTRYRPERPRGRPVLLVHGYSASGTTFAHHAVRPNLAEHLCARGRDVWIVDLRTSSGMPTAREPWAFEDAALGDLPAAVEKICLEARCDQVDVFAHCMGSAMFTIAVLADPEQGYPLQRRFNERIGRAVLSQIAPFVVMSAANTLRGYIMSYVRHFLPFADYQFRIGRNPGLKDQLIDRLLATLPYPEEEFDVENPPWPCKRAEFVGTRHRMDALYGRDFSLADAGGARLHDKVLEYIDDLFGPLSIETVSQAIHFSRMNMITDKSGKGYATPERLAERWTFPTLSLHGSENGLADIGTHGLLWRMVPPEMAQLLRTETIDGFGHQDCLIGKDAGLFFDRISAFLEREP